MRCGVDSHCKTGENTASRGTKLARELTRQFFAVRGCRSRADNGNRRSRERFKPSCNPKRFELRRDASLAAQASEGFVGC
jgi:hypothetical protein